MILPKGVYIYKNNPKKFIAKGFNKRKHIYLGIFDKVEDAVNALKMYYEGIFVSPKRLREKKKLLILNEIKLKETDIIELID